MKDPNAQDTVPVWPRDLIIETEREADGRWLAEVVEVPGALAYGATMEEAQMAAMRLAIRILLDRVAEDLGAPR